MSGGDYMSFSHDLIQRDGFCPFTSNRHHYPAQALFDVCDAGTAKSGGKDTINGGRGASPLQMSKDGYPGFKSGHLFELLGEMQGMICPRPIKFS